MGQQADSRRGRAAACQRLAGACAARVPGAAGNPKAILIFTAFLPQFVNPAEPTGAQFAVLGALFLALELVAMATYSWMGIYLRRWFSNAKGQRIFNRSCAGLLAAAGTGLLAARR